jgi:hypothetical protein
MTAIIILLLSEKCRPCISWLTGMPTRSIIHPWTITSIYTQTATCRYSGW